MKILDPRSAHSLVEQGALLVDIRDVDEILVHAHALARYALSSDTS